ncbi:DNA polymerase III subunit alpha [Photobacterium damselae]|uniref:DNA polymerase III subunit alpha n=1 Tax=Photobacterium damselae TaxID=38293 RepID=UPI0040688025
MSIAFYRTHHSYHEGSCKVKNTISKCVESGINTLVMADRVVLSDAISHYRNCRADGIEPVMGLLLSIYDEKEITDWQIAANSRTFAAIRVIYEGLFEKPISRSVIYPIFSELEGKFITEVKKHATTTKPLSQVALYKSVFNLLGSFTSILGEKNPINDEYVSEISTAAKRSKAPFMFNGYADTQPEGNIFGELLNVVNADNSVCEDLSLKAPIDYESLQVSVSSIVKNFDLSGKNQSLDKFLKATSNVLSKIIPELDRISKPNIKLSKPPANLVTNLKKIAKDAMCIFEWLQYRYQNTNPLVMDAFLAVVDKGALALSESDTTDAIKLGEDLYKSLVVISAAYEEYQFLITGRRFMELDASHSLIQKYKSVMALIRAQAAFADYKEKDESIYPDLMVVAKEQEGWSNLIRLSSLAFLQGQDKGMITLDKDKRASDSFPKTTMATLTEYKNGLVVVLGLENDAVWKAILSNGDSSAVVEKYKRIFGDENVFLAIQHSNNHLDGCRLDIENKINTRLLELATEHGLVAFAMNNAYFTNEEDYLAHDAKSAMILGELTQSKCRKIGFGHGNYLRTVDEMSHCFSSTPELINNTNKLSEHLGLTGKHLQIELDNPVLPDFPVPDGYDIDSWILKLATDGVEEKFALRVQHKYSVDGFEQLSDEGKSEVDVLKSSYTDRLDLEIGIIKDMGFNGYFLIVAEFINWSKNNGVPVGHGRGSGAGSIVAWGLDITDVDPIRYNLLFERFLNPERVSMPDFDVDFGAGYHPITGEFMTRDSVIRHVQDMYNHEGEIFPSVGQIATHGLLSPKSAFKGLCRTDAKNVNYSNAFAKLVGEDPSQQKIKCCFENETLMQRVEREPYLEHLLDMGGRLEGLKQNTGIHAGGVVIARGTMVDHTPVMIDIREPAKIIAQFDKYGVEEAGLVKFDFLGLFYLTIMEIAKKYIKERTGDEVNLRTLSYEDPKVFELLKSGNSHGVFQVESEGMRKLLQAIMCENMEELSALLALYRPGPIQSGMVDNFIARKHGREVISYPDAKWQHECLKPILEPTYGIILYQEQVMQIAQALAGYSLGGADMLRRAMGKKKPEEMAKQREVFEQGAINNGVDGELAMKIFDLVEKFAGYGFNKSHSMAYAHITYQTAWLKTYYPTEYMSALLTSFVTDQDKLKPTIVDCKRNGIQILQPSINKSHTDFRPVEDGVISFGLAGIKGIGEDKLNAIVEERERNGEFKSILDIRLRCPKDFDTRVAEGLLYSGALDDLETFHDCDDKLRNIVDVMGGSLSNKEIEHSRGVASDTSFSLGEVTKRGQEISNEILQVLDKFDADGFTEYLNNNGIFKEDNAFAIKAGGQMIKFVNDLIAKNVSINPSWDLYISVVGSLLEDRKKLMTDYREYRSKVDAAKANIQKLEAKKIEDLRQRNQMASFDKRAYLLKDISAIVGQTKPVLMVLQEYKFQIVDAIKKDASSCDNDTSNLDMVIEGVESSSDRKLISKSAEIAKEIDYSYLDPFADGFRLSRELTYLTYYITGHPFDVDDKRREMSYVFENTPITYINVPSLVVEDGVDDELELLAAKNENKRIKQNTPETRVAGIIVESKKFKVKKSGKNQGREMCILKIDDSTATMTIVVLPDALDLCKKMTSNGSVFACEGQVFYDMFRDDGSISMLPNKIYNPNDVSEVVYENVKRNSRF